MQMHSILWDSTDERLYGKFLQAMISPLDYLQDSLQIRSSEENILFAAHDRLQNMLCMIMLLLSLSLKAHPVKFCT